MEILIVDDSRTMRMLVRRGLRQAGFGGANVREAENGVAALQALQEREADVILADWNMPELDGLGLLNQLKPLALAAKFGFITSQVSPTMRETARAAGASFLLAKPFSPEDLRTALLQIVEECP